VQISAYPHIREKGPETRANAGELAYLHNARIKK